MDSRKTIALIFLVALTGACLFLGYNFLMDRNSINFEDRLYYILGYYSELESHEISWSEFEGVLARARAEGELEFHIRLIELNLDRFEKMLGKNIEENDVYALMYDLEVEKMWYAYTDNPENPEKAENGFVIVSK